MEEIIKSTLLEYARSSFLVDLVKRNDALLYIRIQQTIHLDDKPMQKQEIKINPSLLSDILEVLTAYQTMIPKQQFNREHYLSEEDKAEIIKRYFKGVSISALSLQFDCPEKLIDQILNNRGIPIVSNEFPKQIAYKKFKRKKRRR